MKNLQQTVAAAMAPAVPNSPPQKPMAPALNVVPPVFSGPGILAQSYPVVSFECAVPYEQHAHFA